ncbi:PREDICTED: NIF3-like protein 1 isoform X2 [Chinchilla lanigera]|uniref:NIF3-like protein 1 n=1 Tax=Chinchilla lanigera TaxID=34839 RepID=A0A8C2VUE7_CHILA|nr:PREDICTED: NIF3-like protein 1 isoform X2 [Chinchilla lanigera]
MLASRGRLLRTAVRLSRPRAWRSPAGMDLQAVLARLKDLAPLSFAESWDNVGLLVEPSPPHAVRTLFLTVDLTEAALQEALRARADLVLAYHPPIFRPLASVTCATWKERLVVRALEGRVAIYSPHTALDAAPRGVNAWLAKGLGACVSRPIHPSRAPSHPTEGTHRVELSVRHTQDLSTVLSSLKGVSDASVTCFPARTDGEEQTRLSLNCTPEALMRVVAWLAQNQQLYEKTEILALEKPLLQHAGMGRLCTLDESVSLAAVIERVKRHLKLPHVRLALGVGRTLDSQVRDVALCAGSGSSVLRGVQADLYLTGEMSHHDVLDATSRGISVILCEHSNTERGFLSELRDLLSVHLENRVQVVLSQSDKDPLCVV